MKLNQTWNLNCFYLGKSDPSAFKRALQELQSKLKNLNEIIQDKKDIKKGILNLQSLLLKLHEIQQVITCLNAQDITDTNAHFLQNQIATFNAEVANISMQLDKWLASIDNQTYSSLLQDSQIQPIAFSIKEKRRLAKEKLTAKEEAFINDFAVDGFHGWTQMWETTIGNMTFPFEEKLHSFGQIENAMTSPNRRKRQEAFQSIDTAFRKQQRLFAQILNHLGGFRLTMYRKRGWANILKQPLEENRMQEKTLEAMWNVIRSHQGKLKSYLQCKADLLKISKLSWSDLDAPLGDIEQNISYEDAATFITKHLSHFSPKMGQFVHDVLNADWIDAENRLNKSPGGFCVGMPLTGQSRIFMTYGNNITNVFTLAHELGHAFHNAVIFPLSKMAQEICMNVAETASTMAEIIVTRAVIQEAASDKDRLFILDNHLRRSISYLMNIHARFLFEMHFYKERKKGFVPCETLNEIMKEAQKEAYGETLDAYHPLFWAAKMHFQFADTPFYNFPYTCGYLLSLGIHEFGSKQTHFDQIYTSFLEDTGRMSLEDLAQKHLSVDLTQPTFWENSLQTIDRDIDLYLELAKKESL